MKTPRAIVKRVHYGMMQRCHNPKCKAYKYYGARGVVVCKEWHDFETFYAYVGDRPSGEYSIDRFPNNSGSYEPKNVRWATRDQQNANRSSNRWIIIQGERRILTDWARTLGLSRVAVSYQFKNGPPVEWILALPEVRGYSLGQHRWFIALRKHFRAAASEVEKVA